MVGEDWDNWKDCVRKTIALAPDSVTIYQMELPYNTTFSRELAMVGENTASPGKIADWPTKRAWVKYAFDEFVAAGYHISSAYTVVKDKAKTQFVYRDALWSGADMFGTGVASFGHVQGVHIQNVDTWEAYLEKIDRGELPIGRALRVTNRDRLIREMILQLKTGHLTRDYFAKKFQADILNEFATPFRKLEQEGWLTLHSSGVDLTSAGYLQIDRHLPNFFDPEYVSQRYT
jgi:oxygen-independent coproporphyrinogen-3 oxidase